MTVMLYAILGMTTAFIASQYGFKNGFNAGKASMNDALDEALYEADNAFEDAWEQGFHEGKECAQDAYSEGFTEDRESVECATRVCLVVFLVSNDYL